MRQLDDTDLRILSLLADNARRAYSNIGDEVGLSGPAVSDRVQRLQETGILERFTIEVDREHLRSGVPVLVRVHPLGEKVDAVRHRVSEDEGVEHVFVTAEREVVFFGHAKRDDVRGWIETVLGEHDDAAYEVTLVDEHAWTPSFEGTEFAIACAECSNTVDAQGEIARVSDQVRHFCCASCREKYENRYERLADDA